jgi:hypothetical protein
MEKKKVFTEADAKKYDVENFVYLLVIKKYTKAWLENKIKSFSIDENDKEKALQRLQFATERINKSLSGKEIFFLLIIPFGVLNAWTDTRIFDVFEERQMGYVNRVKQFFLISIIGMSLYIIIPFGIFIFLR